MSFGTNIGFSKPKPRKQSDKWVDLQPRERKPKQMNKVGKKTEFWMFVNVVLELFFVRIGQPRVCEIQSDFCDGYHIAKAHTRRRTTIPMTDWWHAFRVCFACQECHSWADQREREDTEGIIEPIILARFERLHLSEEKVRRLLLQCAEEIQEAEPKYQHFDVIL